MPARFYTDAEIYELEKEGIFYNSWCYVGHISQLKETGRYITIKIHDQNIFVIKTKSGELKAFYNVCLHRGHELLAGEGKTNIIVCPYHAWAYDFDGNLKAARNSENVEGFNKCDFTLKSVQLEVFCGMVFVNLDEQAPSLKTLTGNLEKEIRTYCPTVDDLVFAQRDHYEVESNWKVMVDNLSTWSIWTAIERKPKAFTLHKSQTRQNHSTTKHSNLKKAMWILAMQGGSCGQT